MPDVVICGALGRMGGTVARLVHESPELTLAGGIDIREGSIYGVPVVPAAKISEFLSEKKPDILIDFTTATAAVQNVRAGAAAGVALVIGTTGFTDAQRKEISAAIEGHVPAVISSNFSIGVNIFWQMVRIAGGMLKEYDIEVIEAHHRNKKDAPSGTAKTILQILDESAGPRERLYGREGMTERGREIGVHVIRGGDIVGDHSVLFSGNYETITLSHRAYDRSVFAQGALKAAGWVIGKPPGMYAMSDVLGFRAI